MMERLPVKSSSISSMGYDPSTRTLEVQFHAKDGEGAIWRYAPVPPEIYSAMLLPGASIGQIFAREVKVNMAIASTRVEVLA